MHNVLISFDGSGDTVLAMMKVTPMTFHGNVMRLYVGYNRKNGEKLFLSLDMIL